MDKIAAWVNHAVETRDGAFQTLQTHYPRLFSPEQWDGSLYLKRLIDRNLQITLSNVPVLHDDIRTGMEYLMMARPVPEPSHEALRRFVLQDRIKALVMEKMGMNTFDFVMQEGYRNPEWKGPQQNFAAPLVLYDPANVARIVLLRAPRVVPNQDANDLTVQAHAAKSLVTQIVRCGLPQYSLSVAMNVAYYDPSSQDVVIRDIAEIPGLADGIRKEADTIAEMLHKGLVPDRNPRVRNRVELTPEISREAETLARLKAAEQELQAQIQAQQRILSQRLGTDPEAWPHIPQTVSLGSVTKEWSHHVEPAALDKLSEIGIPRRAVETPEYDLHAMAQALRQAGIAPERFVRQSRVDPEKVKATLHAYGVDASEYLRARPVIHPSRQNAGTQAVVQETQAFLERLKAQVQTAGPQESTKPEPVYSDMGPR